MAGGQAEEEEEDGAARAAAEAFPAELSVEGVDGKEDGSGKNDGKVQGAEGVLVFNVLHAVGF